LAASRLKCKICAAACDASATSEKHAPGFLEHDMRLAIFAAAAPSHQWFLNPWFDICRQVEYVRQAKYENSRSAKPLFIHCCIYIVVSGGW
jgi:hypothetical protein